MRSLILPIVVLSFASSALSFSLPRPQSQQALELEPQEAAFNCELPPVVDPKGDGLPSSSDQFYTDAALKKQIKRLGDVARVPTVCYDDLGDFDEDLRWAPFYTLHEVLEDLFPLVHINTEVTKINRFGLVYTLYGSNTELAPVLLAAHQDVVPVQDASTWQYPPFDAYYDGTFMWGRGVSDDKSSLVGLMSALEDLLATGDWKPRRTIILAFGFDEECGGKRGAGYIGKHLEEKWGPNIAIILDEGGMGLQMVGNDTLYALPAVHEKGHVDMWFELNINGGHSSTPYPHTGIGVISEIVTALESHPYTPELIKGSPIYNHLVCQARYSPDADASLTKMIKNDNLKALAEKLVSIDRPTQYRIQTSQAVDIIRGGGKINAMPESITLGVNYRIAPQDSVSQIQENIIEYITPIVKKYSLTLNAFGNTTTIPLLPSDAIITPTYEVSYNGTLSIHHSEASSTSPISPTTSSPVWDLFSGTIQHTFSSLLLSPPSSSSSRVVPVGEMLTGNTDTRHYWGLSRNIYRWGPNRDGSHINIHTVDERHEMRAHLEGCAFYWDLVRNFDTWEGGKVGEL